jgi:hypothetical protein
MERTGGSFEQKHHQLVREQRMRDEDGLTPTPATASAAMQPPESRAGAENTPDDEGENESEDENEMAAEAEAMRRHQEMMAALARPNVVNVAASPVTVHAHLPKRGKVSKEFTFDADGKPIGMTEEEVEGA